MRAQGGFTLIEIMVVLLIIAGLAYVVGTNVIGQLDKSKI
ncbi:MAG: prepilin-type N-terminal cleavage/methylation domain-containing protein, partial [Candidatus Dadabacteria bacterium]|nr:prepilin-type N-terminal cleavage/methylation domain-containing protein [Candidatus Dadabacteria bacterium]